jgi:hypothetical protein
MEKLYLVPKIEKDQNTGKEYFNLNIYLNVSSLILLQNICISLRGDNAFVMNYKSQGKVYKYSSANDDHKVLTFLNKLINQEYTNYKILILNLKSLVQKHETDNFYKIELLNEKLSYSENSVCYEF